jgi:hypothetical protein
MRKLSGASVAVVMAIAFYFVLFWGYDSLRVLTSPTYGLEDVWRSQFVFAIGRMFELGPMGLLKLAAFFGALKLAVAGVCAVHIVDRFRALGGRKVNSDILEGGLILVVLISVASVGPAVWSQNAEMVREEMVQLLLAAIATALCMLERSYAQPHEAVDPALAEAKAALPRGATWYSPFR